MTEHFKLKRQKTLISRNIVAILLTLRNISNPFPALILFQPSYPFLLLKLLI